MTQRGSRFCLNLKTALAGFVIGACALGCGSGETASPVTPSSKHLSAIGAAYAQATTALDRGPQSKDELMPYLQQEPDPDDPDKPVQNIDIDQVFRSPNDDQDYVILWGVDLREYPGRRQAPVIAYEKQGKDGKRVVLQGRWAHTVSDDRLADLPFPMGFRAP